MLLSPFFYLGAEILARKIAVDTTGITISKFLRSVHLEWSEIQSLDAVRSGSKLFLILQREEGGPVIITNTIRPFPDLVSSLVAAVPAEKISSPVHDLLTDAPAKFGPVIQAWLVCLVFIALVWANFLVTDNDRGDQVRAVPTRACCSSLMAGGSLHMIVDG